MSWFDKKTKHIFGLLNSFSVVYFWNHLTTSAAGLHASVGSSWFVIPGQTQATNRPSMWAKFYHNALFLNLPGFSCALTLLEVVFSKLLALWYQYSGSLQKFLSTLGSIQAMLGTVSYVTNCFWLPRDTLQLIIGTFQIVTWTKYTLLWNRVASVLIWSVKRWKKSHEPMSSKWTRQRQHLDN